MKTLNNLIKIQILGIINGNSSKKNKGAKGIMLLLVALLFTAVIVGLGVLYAIVTGRTLNASNQIEILCTSMIGMATMFGFAMSFYSTANIIFNKSDYELLASLPIKKSSIIISKLFTTFAIDLLIVVGFTVPSFFIYVKYATLTVMEVVYVVLDMIITPLFATSVAIILGTISIYLSSFFKRKNIINTVLTFAFTIGILCLSFISSGTGSNLAIMISKVFPFLATSMVDTNYFLLHLAMCLGTAIIVFAFVVIFYSNINRLLFKSAHVKNYKMKIGNQKSPYKAIFSSEMKKVFSNTNYAINTIMGPFLILAGGVAVCILAYTSNNKILQSLSVFIPAFTCFGALIAPSSASSISTDGQAFWLTKTAPLKLRTILTAKMMVNFVLIGLPIAIVGIVVPIIVQAPWYYSVLIGISAVLVAIFSGVFGLMINLFVPRMKWKNMSEVVKQSSSIFICLVVALLVTAGVVLAVIFIEDKVLALGIIDGALCGANLIFFILFFAFGEKLCRRIEC